MLTPYGGYERWSTEKFRRLIARYEEGRLHAKNKETLNLYTEGLQQMNAAFLRLHPRAFINWERKKICS